ncbi:MAG: FKBP-type peptidyl-prolyl cis-trans isomerase [Gloeomargaritaceae cyanobacterium C42_A2020_066]|nr:FKBP-type peptidyl-prolyl cis-trans isomerase [Gloeomargaritaceae cyanobacterium C42_A2020_066]
MSKILISLGVVVVCAAVLLVAQLTAPAPAALANEETPASETVAATPEEPTRRLTLDDWVITPSGLKYQDLKEGKGASPRQGQTAVVHYTGRLEDGTVFDSSKTRGRPFQFRIGVGQVIKGWDEGVATMRVGGERRLQIPPDLAYGKRGAGGVIPPNATLIFDVELLSIQP